LPAAGTHPVFPADLDYDNFLDAFIGSLYYRGWFPPNFPPRIYWNIFGNFDSRIYSEVWFNEGVDSFGTFGATVADLNNDGYVVIHLSTSINGDGWVDVIFGEKAPFSD
jgi:hypothetical protein